MSKRLQFLTEPLQQIRAYYFALSLSQSHHSRRLKRFFRKNRFCGIKAEAPLIGKSEPTLILPLKPVYTL
jgi:hypothetical protein